MGGYNGCYTPPTVRRHLRPSLNEGPNELKWVGSVAMTKALITDWLADFLWEGGSDSLRNRHNRNSPRFGWKDSGATFFISFFAGEKLRSINFFLSLGVDDSIRWNLTGILN